MHNLGFWEMVVITAAIGSISGIISQIINRVAEVKNKRTEAMRRSSGLPEADARRPRRNKRRLNMTTESPFERQSGVAPSAR